MRRAYRLRRPDQFRRVKREGRIYPGPLLTLNVLVGRRRRLRCGFVVARRIGGAVERNRAKRRLREAVRLAIPLIAPGHDLVFVVNSPAILSAPFPTIQEAVAALLRRAQIWQERRADDPLAPG